MAGQDLPGAPLIIDSCAGPVQNKAYITKNAGFLFVIVVAGIFFVDESFIVDERWDGRVDSLSLLPARHTFHRVSSPKKEEIQTIDQKIIQVRNDRWSFFFRWRQY